MDGRRNFLKTAFATCSLLAGSKLLTACTPIKKVATDEETFETFATPDALKGNQYRCAHSSRSRQMDCLPFSMFIRKRRCLLSPCRLG